LIHRVLETLRYGEQNINSSDAALKSAVDFVRGLKTPPMAEILKSGEAEWGFQVQSPGGLIEGQIDLWGEVDGTLWVVDYKSGSDKFKDKAFEQLSLYAWALSQFGHKSKIKLAVIYPVSQKLEVREFSKSSALHWEQKFRFTQ
jgi:ATP-dependent helicase/nuclease subunit A